MVCRTGGRKMFALTPAPWTSKTGPRVGGVVPLTCTRLHSIPSPARNGITRSTSGGRLADAFCMGLSPEGDQQHALAWPKPPERAPELAPVFRPEIERK